MSDSLRVKDIENNPPKQDIAIKIKESTEVPASRKKGANLIFREMFADAFLRRKNEKKTDEYVEIKQKAPSPYIYLRVMLMYSVLFIVLLSVFYLFNGYEMFPILSAMLATVIPVVTAIFFYEMDTSGRMTLYNVLLLFFIAFSFALAINFISSRFIYEFGGEAITYFGSMAIGLMETAVIVSVCVLCISKFKIKDMITGALIGAVIGAGFSAVNNMGVCFSAAFVQSEYAPMYEIILFNDSLVDSLSAVLNVTVLELILHSLNYIFTGVTFAGVVVYVKLKGKRDRSTVLLFLLVVIGAWIVSTLWYLPFASVPELFVYILRGLMLFALLISTIRTVRTGLVLNVYE